MACNRPIEKNELIIKRNAAEGGSAGNGENRFG
jgi:hypothetical protein